MEDHPPRSALTEASLWRVATRVVLLTLALLFIVWLAVRLQAVVIQALFAVIVAAGMFPLVERMTQPLDVGIGRRTWSPPRAFVVLILYLALFGVVGLAGSLVIPPLASDMETLVRQLPRYAADFEAWVAEASTRYPFLPAFDVGEQLTDLLRLATTQLAGVLGQALVLVRVAMGVLGGALNSIFVLILALYITADSDRIRRYLIEFLPADRRGQAERIAAGIGERLGGWVRGQLLLMVIMGAITLVALSLLGVRYAVLLALLAAIGELIPMLGPIIAAVPAVIIAFIQSPLQGILTLAFYILIQQLENNLVVPKLMERAVALHPLAVMLALLAGGTLLGVMGAILAVPVAAALAVVVDEVRRERDHNQTHLAHGEGASASAVTPPLPPATPRVPGVPDVPQSSAD